MLDDCLERIRDKIPDSFLLEDSTMEEYELMEGEASGFKNFKRKSYRCICGSNLVRIFIEVSFLRILVTYVITLLDGKDCILCLLCTVDTDHKNNATSSVFRILKHKYFRILSMFIILFYNLRLKLV